MSLGSMFSGFFGNTTNTTGQTQGTNATQNQQEGQEQNLLAPYLQGAAAQNASLYANPYASYNPYQMQALQQQGNVSGYVNPIAQGGIDPNSIARFQSPYQQQVIDAYNRNADIDYGDAASKQQAGNALAGNLTGANARGSMAMLKSRDLAMRGKNEADLLNSGFGQAANLANQSAGQQISAANAATGANQAGYGMASNYALQPYQVAGMGTQQLGQLSANIGRQYNNRGQATGQTNQNTTQNTVQNESPFETLTTLAGMGQSGQGLGSILGGLGRFAGFAEGGPVRGYWGGGATMGGWPTGGGDPFMPQGAPQQTPQLPQATPGGFNPMWGQQFAQQFGGGNRGFGGFGGWGGGFGGGQPRMPAWGGQFQAPPVQAQPAAAAQPMKPAMTNPAAPLGGVNPALATAPQAAAVLGSMGGPGNWSYGASMAPSPAAQPAALPQNAGATSTTGVVGAPVMAQPMAQPAAAAGAGGPSSSLGGWTSQGMQAGGFASGGSVSMADKVGHAFRAFHHMKNEATNGFSTGGDAESKGDAASQTAKTTTVGRPTDPAVIASQSAANSALKESGAGLDAFMRAHALPAPKGFAEGGMPDAPFASISPAMSAFGQTAFPRQQTPKMLDDSQYALGEKFRTLNRDAFGDGRIVQRFALGGGPGWSDPGPEGVPLFDSAREAPFGESQWGPHSAAWHKELPIDAQEPQDSPSLLGAPKERWGADGPPAYTPPPAPRSSPSLFERLTSGLGFKGSSAPSGGDWDPRGQQTEAGNKGRGLMSLSPRGSRMAGVLGEIEKERLARDTATRLWSDLSAKLPAPGAQTTGPMTGPPTTGAPTLKAQELAGSIDINGKPTPTASSIAGQNAIAEFKAKQDKELEAVKWMRDAETKVNQAELWGIISPAAAQSQRATIRDTYNKSIGAIQGVPNVGTPPKPPGMPAGGTRFKELPDGSVVPE